MLFRPKSLDHSETPLPNKRAHRGAHFMSVTTGQPLASCDTLQANDGRTHRAITHEATNTAIEATYSRPQSRTCAADVIFRAGLTMVTRHRFHDVTLEACPVGNGAYGLRALVALHASLPDHYARALVDNAVVQEVANFLYQLVDQPTE